MLWREVLFSIPSAHTFFRSPGRRREQKNSKTAHNVRCVRCHKSWAAKASKALNIIEVMRSLIIQWFQSRSVRLLYAMPHRGQVRTVFIKFSKENEVIQGRFDDFPIKEVIMATKKLIKMHFSVTQSLRCWVKNPLGIFLFRVWQTFNFPIRVSLKSIWGLW